MTARNIILILGMTFGGFCFGFHYANLQNRASQLDGSVKTLANAQDKARRSQASGIRTEHAQDAADRYYTQLLSDYEADKKNHPGAGCVLDAVSLRRWNEANAGRGDAALGQPDDGMPEDAAAAE